MKARDLVIPVLPAVLLGGALALPPAPARISAVLGIAAAGLVVDGLLRPGSPLFVSARRRGAGSRPLVALTFDDGPHPQDTPAILEILKGAGLRATFFFVGRKARAHPDLVRRVALAGHEVGNHSDTHPWWFSLAGPGRTRREIREAGRSLEDLAGRPVRFFRPPMGHGNFFLRSELEGSGLEVVTWSVRPFDTLNRSPERIVQKVMAAARPGAIILLHEGAGRRPGEASRSVAALPTIIRGLREKGLEPVSLGSLLEAPFPPQGFSFGGSRPPQELGGS